VNSALKARGSKAQGASPGIGTKRESSLESVKQLHHAFRAFVLATSTQGSSCFAAFTLGFAVARFQRFTQIALSKT
jgi:hypothetical protein